MANLNDREDNPNQVPNSGESNVVNPNPVDYKDGYIQGRAVEQHRYEANQQVRDNDNAGRGLLVGLILAGTAALVGGALYLLNQSNQTPAPVNSTIVVPRAASPSVSPSPEVRERVIERDRIVPVPQAPAQAPAQAPRVNITIPQPSAPAPQAAPATQAAPAAQPSSQPTTPNSSAQPSPSTNSTNSGSQNSPSSGTTNPTGTGSGQ